MIRGKIAFVCGVVLALFSSNAAYTQSNTINVFSPYTIYGLGELQNQGTIQSRSMASAGIAMRGRSSINLLNPASYSTQLPSSVMFNYGMDGGSYLLKQNSASGSSHDRYTTFNFRDLAFQFPIMKGMGMAVSISPYSSVGYDTYTDFVMADYYVGMTYSGSGDITEAKFGVGWEVLPHLSIGLAGQYYWGEINREFVTEFVNYAASGSVNSMSGVDNIYVSSLKGQLGVQWDVVKKVDRSFTVGATYDIGGDLRPTYTRVLDDINSSDDVYAQSDTTETSLVIPRQLQFGVCYSDTKLTLAIDYSLQDWSENGVIDYTSDGVAVSYGTANTLRVGAEYIPRYGDVRRYLNRVSYRAGFRVGTSQYRFAGETLGKYAVTGGMGFPINIIGITKIDLGFEWGGMGSLDSINVDGENIGLVRQNQFRFSLGFTMFGDDYWFRRMRID